MTRDGIKQWVYRVIHVPRPDPDDARRRRLLNVLLLVLTGSIILALILLGLLGSAGLTGGQADGTWLYAAIFLALGGCTVIYVVNRTVSGRLASALFLLLLIASAIVAVEAERVHDGCVLLVFAITIVAASVLLRPWCSFALATLSGLTIVTVGYVLDRTTPNVLTIMALFVLAAVSWLSALNLERALGRLRDSENRHRLVAEALADYAFSFRPEPDGSMVLEWATDEFRQVTGLESVDRGTLDVWLSHVYPDDRPVVTRRMEVLLAGQPDEQEYRIIRDGQVRWLHVHACPVWDGSHQQLERIICAGRDVTEQKQADEIVRRSEEAHRLLFEQSVDGITIIDDEGQIVRANQAFCEYQGLSLDEVLGANPLELVHPDDRETGSQRIRATLEGKPISEARIYRALRPDGTVRWGEVRSTRITWDGKPAIQSIVRDVTERRRAEEMRREYWQRLEDVVAERTRELQQAQQELLRQEKLATLGQLAGGVGHELRNPLGVISNAVYYLRMTLSEVDEPIQEYITIIAAEVRNAERIISELLDFSRTQLPDRQQTGILEAVAEVLERHPPPAGVTVTTDIDSDLPPAYVDPFHLQQALSNLVTNAYQAMPDGGTLTITAGVDQEQVILSVTDTGCGVPPEHMDRLFEPLFTTKARGIGLGLALSQNLMEANEGSIQATSEVGRGSTFTIVLPAKEAV